MSTRRLRSGCLVAVVLLVVVVVAGFVLGTIRDDGRWVELAGTCPTLDSRAARALGATGVGTPIEGPDGARRELRQTVRCTWGGSVDVSVLLTRTTLAYSAPGNAAAQFDQVLGELPAPRPVPTAGDQAAVAAEPVTGAAVLVTRDSNAVLTVRIRPAGPAPNLDSALPRLQELTADVLGDLRSEVS